ncbi:uncharacterized protein LOC144928224 [Branchiostoma floridae x Branchiostoma belcheri]
MGSNESTLETVEYVDKCKDVPKSRLKEKAKEKRQEDEELETDEDLRELQEEANEKRNRLLDYRFGDFHGNKRGMVEGGLRIGLFGPPGSGKGSFINACEMALVPGVQGRDKIQSLRKESNIVVRDFLDYHENDFRLVDTNGFFEHGTDEELTALTNIIFGRIKPGQEITFEERVDKEDSDKYFTEWLHAIIIVLSEKDHNLVEGSPNMSKVREFMRIKVGISPITVITHQGQVRKSQEEDVLSKASVVTGSARDHTFLVNIAPVDKERDYETKIEAMKVMQSALYVAESYVLTHWQEGTNKGESDLACLNQIPAKKTDIDLLKEFDMNLDFGPRLDITRLERWDRAKRYGLNPPEEIRDLILKHENDKEYTHC